MMSKLVNGVWNHKKKVILISGLSIWGTNYAINKKRIHEEMREMCLTAKMIGSQPTFPGEKIRKAVVILNYGAHKGKARKLYENFAAPILNLAGIQLTVYSTNDLKKLREYVEHMEDTDAVIFAGGDSTLFECLQSFLQLSKRDLITTPVGILPLGNSNLTYDSISDTISMDRAKEGIKIAHAAMEIVRGKLFPADVLEIRVQETGRCLRHSSDVCVTSVDDSTAVVISSSLYRNAIYRSDANIGRVGDKEDKDFALTNVQWGPLKEVSKTVPKYWYLGPFAPWLAYALAALKGTLKAPLSSPIQFVNACEGCVKCEPIKVQESSTQITDMPRTWIDTVVPRRRTDVSMSTAQPVTGRLFSEANDDCGEIHESVLQDADFQVLTQNSTPSKAADSQGFVISTSPRLGFEDFKQRLQSRMDSTYAEEKSDIRNVSELKINPTESDMMKYPTIDIDGHSVSITGTIHSKLHSRKILLFNHKQAA